MLRDPGRRTSRSGARRHLLSYGVGECGVCGGRLRVATKRGHALYVCEPHGCVGRRQDRVDPLVACPQEPEVPRINDLPTREQRSDALINARRAARYKFAEDRIRKIVDGAPPLTPEQLTRLAAILAPAADGAA